MMKQPNKMERVISQIEHDENNSTIPAVKVKVRERVIYLTSMWFMDDYFIADENYIYRFNEKIYEKNTVLEVCQEFMGVYEGIWNDYNSKKGVECYELLRQKHYKKQFNTPDYLIPFQNGMFNMETHELEEYSYENHLLSILPFDYTNERPCLFFYAMQTILPNEEDRMKVLKFFRYCLTPSIKFQFAQIWVGVGNNGKTKLIELFFALMDGFATTFDIETLNKDKGRKTELRGKRLALCSEIGGFKLFKTAMEEWKNIITDLNQNARGAYEKAQHWTNTTKFIVTTNSFPALYNNNDEAFWRRWQIIEFKENFTGREDRTIFEDILKYEGGAVLSYILREINDVELAPDFWKDTKDFWLSHSTNVRLFFAEECMVDVNDKILTADLYDEYMIFCNSHEDEAVSKRVFNDDMRRMGFNIIRSTDNLYYFKGVVMKPMKPEGIE